MSNTTSGTSGKIKGWEFVLLAAVRRTVSVLVRESHGVCGCCCENDGGANNHTNSRSIVSINGTNGNSIFFVSNHMNDISLRNKIGKIKGWGVCSPAAVMAIGMRLP